MAIPAALQPLPTRYHRLFEQVVAVVEPDPRVRGLWLSGSLARGTADAGSDLDLLLAVADSEFDFFVDHWRDWLAQITPTLLAKEIGGSRLVFTSLTDRICRLDCVLEPVSAVPDSGHRTRIPVIDRDGLHRRLPPPAEIAGPDPEMITAIIEEFWRIQAIFPAMLLDRGDLLCAREGVQTAVRLVYDVFVACNQPLPPMGVKQFRARLTPEQYELLSAVPEFGSDTTSLIGADLVLCEAMATVGRATAEQVGARYPVEISDSVRQHLAARLH